VTRRRVGKVPAGNRETAAGVAYGLDLDPLHSRELTLAVLGDEVVVTVGCRTVRLTRAEAEAVVEDLAALLAGEELA